MDQYGLAVRPRAVPLWFDGSLALLLFMGTAIWGTLYWKHTVASGQPFYYQHYFEPAVMIACGKGFVVAQPQIPSMIPFLWRQTDRFSCGAIPSGVALGTDGLYQGPWRYLMFAVGVTWRLAGISWSGLGPLFGILFGATIASAYAVFRLGIGPIFAVLCAIALSVSNLHLMYLPYLRDYAKAPFTLILIFLLGLLVTGRAAWKGVLAIAAAYGAVLGIGYGFRTDFLADIPLFFLTLVGFLDGGLFRNARLKAAAAGLCASMFLLTASPILSSVYRSGGCQWHTMLLGFARDFSGPLGVEEPPYELTRQYLDEFVYTTVTSYAARVEPGVGHVEYCQPAYDRATARYLVDLVRHFPADMIVRAYASTLRIVELPFAWEPPRPEAAGPDDRSTNPEAGHRIGLALVIGAIGLAAAASARLGLFLVFFLLYVGGYPAIQFDARHYFHLELIPWWAAGFVLQSAVIGLWPFLRSRGRSPADPAERPLDRAGRYRAAMATPAVRAIFVLAGSSIALVLTLWAARLYQQVAVRTLLETYLSAPRHEIPLEGSLTATFLPVMRAAPRTDPETAEFLDVAVNGWRCGEHPSVTFRYDVAKRKDFSRSFVLPRHEEFQAPTHIFMPVYEDFQGIELPETRPGCVEGIYRVRDTRSLPLMLEVVLAPGWQRSPLYQRLDGPAAKGRPANDRPSKDQPSKEPHS